MADQRQADQVSPGRGAPGADSLGLFAADGLLLIVANGLAGLLYLLVHVVLGRSMAGVDYAALVSLVGLLNVLSVGANALQVAMARRAALDSSSWGALSRQALRRALVVGGPLWLAWCLASFALRPLIGAPSVAALWLLGLVALLQLCLPLIQGILQGRRRFPWLAASAIGGAVARLGAAWLISGAGGGVTEVLGAFVAGAVASLVLACWPVRKHLLGTRLEPAADLAGVERDAARVALGQVALFTLINADLIFASRLLEGETLAAYGKAAMLARVVIFLPLPVVMAMFPRAVVSGRRRLLAAPMLFVLVTATLAAGAVAALPELLLRLLYGAPEAAAPGLARLYAWAVIPLALVEVIVPYLWARARPWAVAGLLVPASGYAVVLLGLAGRPQAIIAAVAAVGGLTLAYLLVLLGTGWRRGFSPGDFSPGDGLR